MKTYTLAVIIALLLIGCGTAISPDLKVPDTEPASIDVVDVTAFIESRADVDYSVRKGQVDLPIWQCREWLAWWFADNYSDLLGNSRYDKEFMMCCLYRYAIFRDGYNYYFGSYELFVESDVFNDYQIYAFVAALEDGGAVPYYPIEPPC